MLPTPLRTFYGPFIRTLRVLVSNEMDQRIQTTQSVGGSAEDQMAAAVVMAVLSTAGIGFLVRFLVGLCKEKKSVWLCYLVRVQPEVMEQSVVQSERAYDPLSRAA